MQRTISTQLTLAQITLAQITLAQITLAAFSLFCLALAPAAHAADDGVPPPPALITGPLPHNPPIPVAPPGTPPEPPVTDEMVFETKSKLREHAAAMVQMINAQKDPVKAQEFLQMVTDCGYLIRYINTPRLKYSVVNKEEKKLAQYLADGTLSQGEIDAWKSDMSGKLGQTWQKKK